MTQKEKELKKIQWTGDNLKEVIEFTGRSPKFDEWFKTWEEYEEYVRSHGNIFKIFFEDGSHYEVPVGSWIIKTPDGINIPYTVTIGRLVKCEDENRLLLLKDLCGRLPYGVMAEYKNSRNQDGKIAKITGIWNISHKNLIMVMLYEKHGAEDGFYFPIEGVKPYLRPMSSMTEEELIELNKIDNVRLIYSSRHSTYYLDAEIVDWLNAHYFDYRGLIPMGLALEAPEGMYKDEEE